MGSHRQSRARLGAGAAALAALTAFAALAPAFPAQELRRRQAIRFAELPAKHVGDSPFRVAARATSGLAVSLAVMSGPATLEKDRLTLEGTPGLVIIRATQPGNALFLAADPAERVLVVNPAPSPPRFLSQPAGGLAQVGDAVTLSVKAEGEPEPALQWRRDGAPVEGATGRRLTIPAAALSDSGAYDVVATNPLGSATSELARVLVGKRRQTIVFEGPFSATVGVPAVLSASATSGLPVRFEIASGAAVLSGSTLTAQWPGTVVIRLSQPGDATFAEASTAYQRFTVIGPP
jgi:hypothetical protein